MEMYWPDVDVTCRRELLACAVEREIKFWDASNHTHLVALPTLRGHVADITTIAFSPDNSALASGAEDGVIIIWDLDSCRLLLSLSHDPESVTSVTALTFNGTRDILASGGSNGAIVLWDTSSMIVGPGSAVLAVVALTALTYHTQSIRALHFSGDGARLLSCGNDANIKLWNLGSNPASCSATIFVSDHIVTKLAVSRVKEGRFAYVGYYDSHIHVWEMARLNTFGRVTDLLQRPFLSSAKSAGLAKEVCLCHGHVGSIVDLCFSPVRADILVSCSLDLKLIIWNCVTGCILHSCVTEDVLRGISWNVDGSRVAAVSSACELIVFNVS
jgi:WD40 repeat protein